MVPHKVLWCVLVRRFRCGVHKASSRVLILCLCVVVTRGLEARSRGDRGPWQIVHHVCIRPSLVSMLVLLWWSVDCRLIPRRVRNSVKSWGNGLRWSIVHLKILLGPPVESNRFSWSLPSQEIGRIRLLVVVIDRVRVEPVRHNFVSRKSFVVGVIFPLESRLQSVCWCFFPQIETVNLSTIVHISSWSDVRSWLRTLLFNETPRLIILMTKRLLKQIVLAMHLCRCRVLVRLIALASIFRGNKIVHLSSFISSLMTWADIRLLFIASWRDIRRWNVSRRSVRLRSTILLRCRTLWRSVDDTHLVISSAALLSVSRRDLACRFVMRTTCQSWLFVVMGGWWAQLTRFLRLERSRIPQDAGRIEVEVLDGCVRLDNSCTTSKKLDGFGRNAIELGPSMRWPGWRGKQRWLSFWTLHELTFSCK